MSALKLSIPLNALHKERSSLAEFLHILLVRAKLFPKSEVTFMVGKK